LALNGSIRLLGHLLRFGQLGQLLVELLQLLLGCGKQLVALGLVLLVQLGYRKEGERDWGRGGSVSRWRCDSCSLGTCDSRAVTHPSRPG